MNGDGCFLSPDVAVSKNAVPIYGVLEAMTDYLIIHQTHPDQGWLNETVRELSAN